MESVVRWGIVVAFCVLGNISYAATPDIEQIWQQVQQQQLQIESLQAELIASQRRLEEAQSRLQSQSLLQESRITETESALEATVVAIESNAFVSASDQTTIGGYGEVHYNNFDSGSQPNEIDMHRFVLFFSHQFNQEISFYSEVEIEHTVAGEGKPGEVEIEQAFIQWDYADHHRSRMGIFLIPAGILNETHEPDTFYGIERNAVEKQIIPATWWEAGVAFDGEIAPGWSYDLAIHSGLKLDTGNDTASKRSSIRSARQKVAKANADSLAYTARLRFSGIQGLQWNMSLQYQSDLSQNDADGIGVDEIAATLFETNFSYHAGGLMLRALYARWDIDDTIELLNLGSDEQQGWYIEPSYRFDSLGVFMRYSRYDLTAGSSATSNEKAQFDIGFNYWLDNNVVIKADYQWQDNDNGNDIDGFNLGVGYSF